MRPPLIAESVPPVLSRPLPIRLMCRCSPAACRSYALHSPRNLQRRSVGDVDEFQVANTRIVVVPVRCVIVAARWCRDLDKSPVARTGSESGLQFVTCPETVGIELPVDERRVRRARRHKSSAATVRTANSRENPVCRFIVVLLQFAPLRLEINLR